MTTADDLLGYLGRNDTLKRRMRDAVAWGAPDNWSTGMAHSEFTGLLSKALRRIEELETKLAKEPKS